MSSPAVLWLVCVTAELSNLCGCHHGSTRLRLSCDTLHSVSCCLWAAIRPHRISLEGEAVLTFCHDCS